MLIRTHSAAAGVLAVLAFTVSAAAAGDKAKAAEAARFDAFAVDRNATGTGATAGRIEIVVERWSTDEERQKLRTALQEGEDELLDALRETRRVGYIRAQGGGLGWNLQYARRHTLPDGGSRVVVATDRPMSFFERTQNPRSADYEFLIAELRLDREGEGEGKLVPAARIRFDKGANAIEIENYDSEPVQLTRVVEQGVKDDRKAKDKAVSPAE